MGLPEIIMFSIFTAVAILAVSYVLGIILVEIVKVPTFKRMNKKLAALITGFAFLLFVITAIGELGGYF